jgi:hypothetical protein
MAVTSTNATVEAATFYADSSRNWSACANRRINVPNSTGSVEASFGTMSDQNGLLSISATGATDPNWTQQRAFTVRNNVVADVRVTSESPSSQFAVTIAEQIAGKVHE